MLIFKIMNCFPLLCAWFMSRKRAKMCRPVSYNPDVVYLLLSAVCDPHSFASLSRVNRLFARVSLDRGLQRAKRILFSVWEEDREKKTCWQRLPNRQRFGVFEEYWDVGMRRLKERVYYNAHGELDGAAKSWWRNGNLHSILHYRRGQLHGYAYYCDSDGIFVRGGHYKAGKRCGVHWMIEDGGTKVRLVPYEYGMIHGEVRVCHFYSGNLFQTIEYSYNERDGRMREYHPHDGSLLKLQYYKAGRKHGTTFCWNQSGRLLREENHMRGFLHGSLKKWSPRGRLLVHQRYSYGRKEGEQWKRGKKKTFYFRGRRLSRKYSHE